MVDVPSMGERWRFQLRAIKALVLRDMVSRNSDSRLAFFWPILIQILVMVALLLVFTVRGRNSPGGIPLSVHLTTGYPFYFAFVTLWSTASNSCIKTDSLLMFPQITIGDLIVSSVVLETASHIAGYLVIVVGMIMLMHTPIPARPFDLAISFLGCMWLGVGVGLVIGSIRRYLPYLDNLLSPVKRLGLFISGVVMSANEIPSFALKYFSWNPVFKLIEIARESWIPSYHSPLIKPWDVLYVCVALTALGLILERATRRQSTR